MWWWPCPVVLLWCVGVCGGCDTVSLAVPCWRPSSRSTRTAAGTSTQAGTQSASGWRPCRATRRAANNATAPHPPSRYPPSRAYISPHPPSSCAAHSRPCRTTRRARVPSRFPTQPPALPSSRISTSPHRPHTSPTSPTAETLPAPTNVLTIGGRRQPPRASWSTPSTPTEPAGPRPPHATTRLEEVWSRTLLCVCVCDVCM